MPKKQRVLVVGPVPPPMGGIVRYAQDMMTGELAQRHELTLFRDNVPFSVRPRAPTAGFRWNILARDGVASTTKTFEFIGMRMVALDRALASGRYDILHVLSTAGLGFFRNTCHIQIGRRHGVKTVFHLLGQIDDLYRDSGALVKRMVRDCLDTADVHVTQSPGLAEFVAAITKKPVRSIVNGVRVDELAPPLDRTFGDNSRLRVGSVGVLGHRKGTFDVIEALAILKGRGRDVHVTWAGAGDLDLFRRTAADKAVAEMISFVGPVSEAERVDLLHSSDAFLLPSHAEGQPIALLEGIVAGLPVISTPVGCIPEVVGPENGFLVTPGDTQAIADRLEQLAVDVELRKRMAMHNESEGRQRYNLHRVMCEIGDLYDWLGAGVPTHAVGRR